MNGILSLFSVGQTAGASHVRPQVAAGQGEAPVPFVPVETVETNGGEAPTSPTALPWAPGSLAMIGRETGASAMPTEGKVASLMTSTPGPEPLSAERAGALKHELRVLDELGYLQHGNPDFPRTADHEQAFTLMEKGQPVFWRNTPNSDPIHFTSWDHMEQTAREARERTCR